MRIGILGSGLMGGNLGTLFAQMLIAGRFTYVQMGGEPMRYRKAYIRYYNLTGVRDAYRRGTALPPGQQKRRDLRPSPFGSSHR